MLEQAVEKRPSAALHSSCFTAAYEKYASFLMISRALHLSIFEQPALTDFFNNLLNKLMDGPFVGGRFFSAERVGMGIFYRNGSGHDVSGSSRAAASVGT